MIDGRRKVLGERENETLIPGDLFDLRWADGVDKDKPTLIMYFYVDDCEAFARKADCRLIEWRPFFKDARVMLKKTVSLYTRIAMRVTDKDARLKILHLELVKKDHQN